jgi:hypothetical protein
LNPTYGTDFEELTPAKLDDRALIAIGRLIRACAEVEDIIGLFICNLAEINPSKAHVLIGKSPISRKIEVARYLAKMGTKKAQELASWALNDQLQTILTIRNTVAHGVLMGRTKDDQWSFLTAKTEDPEGTSAIQVVGSFTTEYLEMVADAAETSIPTLEDHLSVKDARAERTARPLAPHRKGHKQASKKQQASARES